MDKKKLFFICIFFLYTTLYSKEKEIVQIIANTIEQNGTNIHAYDDVLLFSPNYYISARKIILNREKSTVELFGNIKIVQPNKQTILSEYSFIDFKNEISKHTPILLIDKQSQIWINGSTMSGVKDTTQMRDATLSSCEIEDPTWSVSFDSGDFNQKEGWINIYNNTFYIKNIPAWYFLIPAIPFVEFQALILPALLLKTPYFGFPTNKDRRTGLLIPNVGYSQEEGWYYAQPIYYAPSKNYDFTIIPQIRTGRGKGYEFEYRLADSAYSIFEFKYGSFYEDNAYFLENNLINQIHRGWNVSYKRSKLFTKSDESNDGLSVEISNLDDVEYINTQYNSKEVDAIDRLLPSKISYYYENPLFHFNTNLLHYKDISKTKEENKQIIQTLPEIQVHQYSKELNPIDILIGNDIKYKRHTREEGVNAKILEYELALRYSHYLFNDFILFGIDKTYFFSQIDYSNDNSKYINGTLLKDTSGIYFDIDLLKPYDEFIHNINFNVRYTDNKNQIEKGDLFGITSNELDLSPFSFIKEPKTLNFTFFQALFERENKKQTITHQLRQNIIFNSNENSKFSNLENDISLNLDEFTFGNKLRYSHEDKLITSSLSSFKTNFYGYGIKLDYSYNVDFNTTSNSYKNSVEHESIVSTIDTKVLRYYTLHYKQQYNISDDIVPIREIGIGIDKKCWGLEFKIADNLIATASNDDRERRQKIIYATVVLKPIGEVKQTFIQDVK